MAEVDSMQTTVMQVAMQAATVAVMTLKEAAQTLQQVPLSPIQERHRPRHGRPALRQQSFNWKVCRARQWVKMAS